MNEPTIRPDRLARLRRLCLGQPNTEEKIAWGDPTWRLRGGKMFAAQKGNVPGHRPSLWVIAPPGAQAFLVEGDPERFFVPPYVGKQGWVGYWMDGARVDWTIVRELVEQAYTYLATGPDAARPRRVQKRVQKRAKKQAKK